MSLISYDGLVKLVKKGVIDAPLENINGASIDITLDDSFLIEPRGYRTIDLAKKDRVQGVEILGALDLQPNQFALASSKETFNLPSNIAAEYKLKSSLARSGIQHLMAGWCDPGWTNSKLTLELKNVTLYQILRLTPGMKIGQMVFWECEPVPSEHDYSSKGQYNNQSKATGNKGLK